MKKFHTKYAEPIEVLENVLQPCGDYSGYEEERPIVNIYKYHFDNDFGVEVICADKDRLPYTRFVVYKKDSDVVEKFGDYCWSGRGTIRRIFQVAASPSKKHKLVVEEWKDRA
jgi:hypothetical protein